MDCRSCKTLVKLFVFGAAISSARPQVVISTTANQGLITNADLCIKDRYGYVEAECGVCVVEFVIGRGEQGDDQAGVATGRAVDPRVVKGEEDNVVQDV
ncbi:hypothetical protein RHSIM_Rhsim04G0047000 [Rhododendron simsii]|uniref:Uncharacterized protein n=1 Tax=Rhododendron simsii TaxID=118357 RepID=A0A834LM21_RHOSS|nr:hypothetical protein RHSIM_Rhsim04G0047000 [Rhododendron simsii]